MTTILRLSLRLVLLDAIFNRIESYSRALVRLAIGKLFLQRRNGGEKQWCNGNGFSIRHGPFGAEELSFDLPARNRKNVGIRVNFTLFFRLGTTSGFAETDNLVFDPVTEQSNPRAEWSLLISS